MDHWPGHRPRWRWHGEVQRIAPHPATPTQIRSVMYEIGTPGSLEASDWFDELALDPEAHPVAMGTRALGDRPWLVADGHRDHELAIKNELLASRRDQVLYADGTLGRSCHRTCPAGRRPSCTCGHAPDRTCCPIGAGRFVFAAATADRLASRCELLVCPDQVASTGEGWPAHRGGAWPGPWLRRTDHDQGRSALRPTDRSAGMAQELVPHDRYQPCFNPTVRSTRRSSPPVRCSMTSTSAANAKHYVGS